MKNFEILTQEEIKKQFHDLGTSVEEVEKSRKVYFEEAERYAKELGFNSLKEVPTDNEEFDSHMEQFSFHQIMKK